MDGGQYDIILGMVKIEELKRWQYGLFAALVMLAGFVILFWPEITGKNLPPIGNIGLYHYIYFTATSFFINILNMLPNWWPAYNSGYPINLTLDGFLNPFFLLALKFIPPFLANNLAIIFLFVINGLSFYALARALKLSRTAGLISAISYAFSGVIVHFSVVTTIAALMPFLPLSFLCCLKIFEGRTKWFWAWLALMTYSWFGGWSEMIVYALTAVGFFAVYLIFKNRKSENFSFYYPLLFFGAIPLSMLILSPWFLSILHFVSYSERAGGTGEAGKYMPTTLSHLLHMLNPRISVLYGDLLPFFSLGNHPYFLFFGTLPFLLALSAFFIKNLKENKNLLFFMGLSAGAIFMTVNNSPLFWLFHQIPVLKWFGGYWKWSFVIVFSLAMLAGYGFDNIGDFFRRKFSKRAIAVLWIFFAVALIGAGTIAIFDRKIQSTITSYGVAHYQNASGRVFVRPAAYYERTVKEIAESLTYNFSLKNKWIILMTVLWFMTLLYFTLGRKYGEINLQRWKAFAILVAFAGSVLPWYGFLKGPPISYLRNEPETAKFLHSIEAYASNKLPLSGPSKDLVPYRIFLYVPEQYVAEISEKYGSKFAFGEANYDLFKEMMDDNAHVFFNFDTFQNHQTLSLQRLMDVYFLVRRQDLNYQNRFTATTPFEKFVEDFSKEKNMRLLGALNVKYILSFFELKTGMKPIFTNYIRGIVPIYIYKNPYFMPRWHFADKILWADGGKEDPLKTLDGVENLSSITLLETQTSGDPALLTKSNPNDKIELELYTAGALRLKTKTENYRFLVFSESRFPDFWQATINGQKTPIYTANYLYQAILVPPGENIVEFRYPKLMEQSAIALNKRIESLLKINN